MPYTFSQFDQSGQRLSSWSSKSDKPKSDKALDKAYKAALASAAKYNGMKCPSVSALVNTFKISAEDAKEIRALCKLVDEPEGLASFIAAYSPKTQEYVRRMHSDPYHSRMWRRTVVLDAINNILDAHGVEGLGPDLHGPTAPPYEYINMGDTYAATLIYKRSGDRLFIGSWGDIVEKYGSAWE
jgi:hypothetical protein